MLAVENILRPMPQRAAVRLLRCMQSVKLSFSFFNTKYMPAFAFLKRILFPHHFGKNVISGLFAEFKSFRVLRNQRSQACFSVQFNHSSSLNENSLLSIMFLQN